METMLLTRHARNRMRWRGVTEDDVRRVLNSPDRVELALYGRKHALAAIAGRNLRVTYAEEGDVYVVISVPVVS